MWLLEGALRERAVGGLAGAPHLTQEPTQALSPPALPRSSVRAWPCTWPRTPLTSHFTWDLPHHRGLSWLSQPLAEAGYPHLPCPLTAPTPETASRVPAVPRCMQLPWAAAGCLCRAAAPPAPWAALCRAGRAHGGRSLSSPSQAPCKQKLVPSSSVWRSQRAPS